MNTTKNGMRVLLASAAAGALVLGSAAGAATAKGKPETAPAPQTTVKLQSVSIKGHAPLDLGTADLSTAAINLRATVRDPKRVVVTSGDAAAKVEVGLAIFTRKTGDPKKYMVPGTETIVPGTMLLVTDASKASKNKKYTGAAKLTAVWTVDQLAAVDKIVNPGTKAYACIWTADVVGVDNEKKSTKVKKRLSTVRDCVKVVDSTVDPVQVAPTQ